MVGAALAFYCAIPCSDDSVHASFGHGVCWAAARIPAMKWAGFSGRENAQAEGLHDQLERVVGSAGGLARVSWRECQLSWVACPAIFSRRIGPLTSVEGHAWLCLVAPNLLSAVKRVRCESSGVLVPKVRVPFTWLAFCQLCGSTEFPWPCTNAAFCLLAGQGNQAVYCEVRWAQAGLLWGWRNGN